MATRANKRDGGEAVVEAIRNLGIRHVITSPGSEWSPVWEALTRQRHENIPGPAYMQVWHENLAVNIATGYTFMTGEPQAVMLHAGVGSLQGVMGMHAAMQSEVPMLVLAGESVSLGADPDLKVEAQWYGGVSPGGIDRLVSNSVKWSSQVPSAPTLYRSIVRAGEMAQRAPKGPVFLDVPLEYMIEDWVPDRELSRVPPPSRTQAVAAELEELIADINKARNPVIITEFAGRIPGAFEALTAFAEAAAIPVIGGRTATYGNFPTDNDLWLGIESYDHLPDADLVLLVGSRTPWYPPFNCPTAAKIVAIGEQPHKEWLVYQDMHAGTYLEGDLAATLSAATRMLNDGGPDEATKKARRGKWSAVHNEFMSDLKTKREAAARDGALNAVSVSAAIEEVMPPDTVFVDETITHFLTMRNHLSVTRPNSLYKQTVGGLGQGLGVALGLKLGAPERPVVVFAGDGSFLYNPITQALGASRDYGLPITIVVMNNNGYQAMLKGHQLYYSEGMVKETDLTYGFQIEAPVFEELGTPLGARGVRVESYRDFKRALEDARAENAEGRTMIINAILPN